MNPQEPILLRSARWLTFGSAAAIMLGIAPSQILLALSFAALLACGEKLRLPRIRLPLALFMLGTVISLLLSDDPVAGLPQIRKFYVFLELLVVFSLLRSLAMVRNLFLTWAGIGALTAIRGCIQFAGKVQEAHRLGRNFYEFYVGERITGFTSHWNTYSAEEMFALIMLASFLFFAPAARRRLWVWLLCAALIALAIVLGETRGIWIAVATWPTGRLMIERHPWYGLGPEAPHLHFDEYVPADIPRPLPSGWYGHLHNIYLHYAAERGIPTMLVLMWMLIQILVDFWRGLKTLPPGPGNRRFLLHGGIAAVLATMVEGCVELNLGDSEVLTMFLVVVACGYLALEKELGGACFSLPPERSSDRSSPISP